MMVSTAMGMISSPANWPMLNWAAFSKSDSDAEPLRKSLALELMLMVETTDSSCSGSRMTSKVTRALVKPPMFCVPLGAAPCPPYAM